MMKNPRKAGILLLRTMVALLLIIHGIARIWLGIVDDFGGFLTANHFPLGTVIAWILTVGEIAGGALLLLGYVVVPLCGWFALELLMGIILVHFPEGWFVVGAGRNGMEYSVLLITALAVIALWHTRRATNPDADTPPA